LRNGRASADEKSAGSLISVSDNSLSLPFISVMTPPSFAADAATL